MAEPMTTCAHYYLDVKSSYSTAVAHPTPTWHPITSILSSESFKTRYQPRFGRISPLVHCDLGTGDIEVDRRLAEFTASHIGGLLRSGGLAISDQEITLSDAEPLPLPDSVRAGRYFIQRAA